MAKMYAIALFMLNHFMPLVHLEPFMKVLLPQLPILLILFLLSAVGCTPNVEKKRVRPPAPVLVAPVATADIPQRLTAVGAVEATDSISVRPQISGELAEVYFTEGQDVVRGQKLFLLDPRAYQATLKKAEASLIRNRVIMENARKDQHRYEQLVKDGIVTHEQAEGYRTRAESAAADVEADKAAVEHARVQLSYTTITAPVSGRLGNLSVSRGNVLEASKTILVTLNSISPIYVTFTLPERELAGVRKRLATGKMAVEAALPGGAIEHGVISFLDNTVESATGTIKLKGRFDNTKRTLWPGQYVQVSLTLAEHKDVLTVPSQAVQTGQKGLFVFVVRPDKTAEMRPVTTGPSHRGLTVILQGLKAGEQVVIDGQLRVQPDAAVEIKKADQNVQAQKQPPVLGK